MYRKTVNISIGIYGKEKKITRKEAYKSYLKYSHIRDLLGYTDYKVAKLADVPMVSIYDWRKGESMPKASKLRNICEVLGVKIEDIVDRYERKEA